MSHMSLRLDIVNSQTRVNFVTLRKSRRVDDEMMILMISIDDDDGRTNVEIYNVCCVKTISVIRHASVLRPH